MKTLASNGTYDFLVFNRGLDQRLGVGVDGADAGRLAIRMLDRRGLAAITGVVDRRLKSTGEAVRLTSIGDVGDPSAVCASATSTGDMRGPSAVGATITSTGDMGGASAVCAPIELGAERDRTGRAGVAAAFAALRSATLASVFALPSAVCFLASFGSLPSPV